MSSSPPWRCTTCLTIDSPGPCRRCRANGCRRPGRSARSAGAGARVRCRGRCPRTSSSPAPSASTRQRTVDAAARRRVANGVVDQVGQGAQQLATRCRRSRRSGVAGEAAGRGVRPTARKASACDPLRAGASTGSQRSAGGRGLPSSCASVSRSSTRVCMRCGLLRHQSPARGRARLRCSGRLPRVSIKPDSTVSGVRISCETLATKSRRMASVRSLLGHVLRQHQLHAVAVAAHQHRQACRGRAGVRKVTGSSKRPACR